MAKGQNYLETITTGTGHITGPHVTLHTHTVPSVPVLSSAWSRRVVLGDPVVSPTDFQCMPQTLHVSPQPIAISSLVILHPCDILFENVDA